MQFIGEKAAQFSVQKAGYYVRIPNDGMPNVGMPNDGMPNSALMQEYQTTECRMPKK
jgi:hypothetical protein